MAEPGWRTIKVRTPAAGVIQEIQELVRTHGIGHLEPVVADALRTGATAGDVVGAALALLRRHVTETRPRKR